jgi:hypothetical protein
MMAEMAALKELFLDDTCDDNDVEVILRKEEVMFLEQDCDAPRDSLFFR